MAASQQILLCGGAVTAARVPNTLTPVFCCGLECGQLASTAHWNTSTGVSISTTTTRSGGRSLRCNPSAQTANTNCVVSAGSTVVVGRAYVYFASLPTANIIVFGTKNSGSSGTFYFGVGFKQSDSSIYAALYNGFATSFSFGTNGFAIATGQWYQIDYLEVVGGVNTTVDVQVNEIPVSQFSTANTSTNTNNSLGHVANYTADIFFDDVVFSNTQADYPIGAGYVNHFIPVSDGTHNITSAGDFLVGAAGANITNSTTNSYTYIDDVPLESAVNDFINMALDSGGGAEYVEHLFGPASGISTPTAGPRAVEVICGFHQASTGSANSTFKLNDAGTEDTYKAFSGAGATSILYARKHYANAPSDSNAWSVSGSFGNFNNLKHRFGYSTSANPDQYLDCVMIEAEFGTTPNGPSDPDARLFLFKSGITDATIKSAINQLILDFKSYGIWTKMKAIYPFVGGTSSTHKWNLKNPLDTDAAFRLVFNGTITHDSNGITPNGSTGYADTKFNGSAQSINNDSHLSVYVRTNSAAADKTEINAYDGASAYWGIKCRDTGDFTFNGIYRFATDGFIKPSNSNSSGMFALTRRSSSDAQAYRNGSSTGTTTTSSQNIPNTNVLIGTRGDHASSFSDRNIAFASIGNGLTTQNVADLYTAVQAFQTTLSRQV